MSTDMTPAEIDLAAGVPLAERPKKRVAKNADLSLPVQEMEFRYGMGVLGGRRAHTNGYFAIVGEPRKPELVGKDLGNRLETLTTGVGDPATPIGYAKIGDVEVIVFDDGGMINAGVYDYITKHFFAAVEFRRPAAKYRDAYAILSGVDLVGVVMPLYIPRVPIALRPLINRHDLVRLDRLAVKAAEEAIAKDKALVASYEKSIARLTKALEGVRTKADRKRHESLLASDKRRLADCNWRIHFNNEVIARLKPEIAAYERRGLAVG